LFLNENIREYEHYTPIAAAAQRYFCRKSDIFLGNGHASKNLRIICRFMPLRGVKRRSKPETKRPPWHWLHAGRSVVRWGQEKPSSSID